MTNQELWDIANRQRQWLTAEEFLAQVEAYRREREKNPLKTRKPFVPGPFVRTYVLDWSRKYTPRPTAAVVGKVEVTS